MYTSPLFFTGLFALLFGLNACKNDPKPQVTAQRTKVDTIQVPAPSNEPPTEFVLTHGMVNWSGRKSLGDAHLGTLLVKKGSLMLRKETLVSGKFTMDMQSIAVTDITDAGERRDLESHLKDADFFETEKFPEAEFVIREALPSTMPEFNWLVIGDLTMKGKTNPVRIPVKITLDGDKLKAISPTFPIQRTLWGVNFRSGILGTAKDKMIDDNVMLSLVLEAKKG